MHDSALKCDRLPPSTQAHAMTAATAAPRRLACARCGAAFDCNPAGGCWCADESFRLPLPTAASEDCLCPTCLRALAEGQAASTPR
jgi:hypothetical protein